jgi:hypothetical protein
MILLKDQLNAYFIVFFCTIFVASFVGFFTIFFAAPFTASFAALFMASSTAPFTALFSAPYYNRNENTFDGNFCD